MKIIADTNVLVRLVTGDDESQSVIACKAVGAADAIVVSIYALCKLAWVLDRLYRVARFDIANAIQEIIGARNVAVDRSAAEAGLAMLRAGGDFADAVIAYDGRWHGGETFVSFDKMAVKLLHAGGRSAKLLQ